MASKALTFYARFAPSFTRIGYLARGLPLRSGGKSLAGQSWLVTGATGGIGRALALGAARRGARVIAVGRNAEKLKALADEGRRQKDGGPFETIERDLSLVADNLSLAEEVGPLDALINNVGNLPPEHRLTPEGFEQSYATSLLGQFALTEALLEQGKLDGAAVVNMASGGMYNAPLDNSLLDLPPDRYNGFLAYAANKRAQLALADHWAARVDAYTMHPGWVATQGVSDALPWMDRWIGPLLRSPAQGADTALWLASKRPKHAQGRIWFDRAARKAHHYDLTRNPRSSVEDVVAKLRADVAKVENQS